MSFKIVPHISSHYDFEKRNVDESKEILEDISKIMEQPTSEDEIEPEGPILLNLSDEEIDQEEEMRII